MLLLYFLSILIFIAGFISLITYFIWGLKTGKWGFKNNIYLIISMFSFLTPPTFYFLIFFIWYPLADYRASKKLEGKYKSNDCRILILKNEKFQLITKQKDTISGKWEYYFHDGMENIKFSVKDDKENFTLYIHYGNQNNFAFFNYELMDDTTKVFVREQEEF